MAAFLGTPEFAERSEALRVVPPEHLPCDNFGLCSECDVKIKNNHYQQFGYTSVDIRFADERATL